MYHSVPTYHLVPAMITQLRMLLLNLNAAIDHHSYNDLAPYYKTME